MTKNNTRSLETHADNTFHRGGSYESRRPGGVTLAGFAGNPAHSALVRQSRGHTASVQHAASARTSGRGAGQPRQELTFVPRSGSGEGTYDSYIFHQNPQFLGIFAVSFALVL